jgi:hypothetical protein
MGEPNQQILREIRVITEAKPINLLPHQQATEATGLGVEAGIEALAGTVAALRLELEVIDMVSLPFGWVPQSHSCSKYVSAFSKLSPQGQQTWSVLILHTASAISTFA